ncbi:MAG TPA: RES family NAD+ phosphorylase, partial [Candidatus Dormibacteraeota bacterium]|nr:RES family NAD+ phosphorylase [Candidatus Dormibacteraeota bacterium]
MVAVKIAWPRAHRIVSRQDAPISAFDKLVDNPLELEALLRVEALTNPLARDAFKTLPAIPVSRRYNGPLAGLIMTPFVIPRTSRFSNGSYGVLYAGYEENTALRESAHHQSLRLNASKAPAGIAISMHGFLVDV